MASRRFTIPAPAILFGASPIQLAAGQVFQADMSLVGALLFRKDSGGQCGTKRGIEYYRIASRTARPRLFPRLQLGPRVRLKEVCQTENILWRQRALGRTR